MQRIDVHRPSAIDPSEYVFVGVEYDKIEDLGDALAIKAEREAIRSHMEMTGGTYSRHEHGGNCHICGASAIYTALFYHEKTNTYIRTGFTCAEKMHMGDPDLFKSFKTKIDALCKAKAGRLKAEAVLEEEDLKEAWVIYSDWKDGKYGIKSGRELRYEEATICDIVDKLVRYGWLTDKQLEFLKVLPDRIERRPEIDAERERERAKAKPCPEGRVEIKAEVIKTEYRQTDFGETLKMLVKATEGYLLWGTVPRSLEIFNDQEGVQRGLKRGDKIRFRATIQPSDQDEKFGFFKRPSNAELI